MPEFDVCVTGAGPAGVAAAMRLGILVNRSVSLKKARLEVRGFIMVLYLPKRCGNYHGIISVPAVGTVVISPKMLKLIFHTL